MMNTVSHKNLGLNFGLRKRPTNTSQNFRPKFFYGKLYLPSTSAEEVWVEEKVFFENSFLYFLCIFLTISFPDSRRCSVRFLVFQDFCFHDFCSNVFGILSGLVEPYVTWWISDVSMLLANHIRSITF